ncbi:MAG: hypothetical protein ACI90V_011018, partial [Bacillariaceae sp.]
MKAEQIVHKYYTLAFATSHLEHFANSELPAFLSF